MTNNRLTAMNTLAAEMRAEGQTSRADCVEELILALTVERIQFGALLRALKELHASLPEMPTQTRYAKARSKAARVLQAATVLVEGR